jgi:diazepam-binding inhibitor (GABA receptor modulating acyl-CoA-binding protein)
LAGLPQEKALELYSLFKQGTVGDVNVDRPGMFDQKGRYKWDAWNARKGTSQEEAQQQYIELAEALLS